MQTSFIVVQSLVFFQHRPFINAGKVSHFDPLLYSEQNVVAVKEQDNLVNLDRKQILLFNKSRHFNNNTFIITIHLY